MCDEVRQNRETPVPNRYNYYETVTTKCSYLRNKWSNHFAQTRFIRPLRRWKALPANASSACRAPHTAHT